MSTLGLDAGLAGRLSRFALGILLLFWASQILAMVTPTTGTFALTAVFFAVILGAYISAHRALGERVFRTAAPWGNTAILVVPLFAIILGTLFGFGPGAMAGMPEADPSLMAAALIYIGLSLILSGWSRYGGCEVIEIPNRLFHRRYRTYCVPLVAVDATEKVIADRRSRDR